MRRVVMKIAYDGTAFHGQARQPGLRTVEGEVIQALLRARAIEDSRKAKFQSASRTDRGVSALGNAVAFDSGLRPDAAVRAFNAKARGVWAWAAAEVPDAFSARRALERWYRYLLPAGHNAEALDTALRIFKGEHDFRNFTRDRTRTVARIDLARAIRDGDHVALDFKAASFRWNLVRRLVAAALRAEAGHTSLQALRAALEDPRRIDMGLAPAEPLVLMDVTYEVPIPRITDPTTEGRLRRLLEGRTRSAILMEKITEKFANP